jgi:hypothetical protein
MQNSDRKYLIKHFVVLQLFIISLLLLISSPAGIAASSVLLVLIVCFRAVMRKWYGCELLFTGISLTMLTLLKIHSLPNGLLFLLTMVLIIQFFSLQYFQRLQQFDLTSWQGFKKPAVINTLILMAVSACAITALNININLDIKYASMALVLLIILVSSQLSFFKTAHKQ